MRNAASMFLLFLVVLAGCGPVTGRESVVPGREVAQEGGVVKGTGTVTWFEIEGGFFAIRGDDGTTYDPIDLPAQFRKDGLRVRFEARVRSDLVSAHMVGPVVEVVKIVEA